MQNVKAYQGLLDTHYDEADEIDEFTKTQRKDFMKQVIGDAEKFEGPVASRQGRRVRRRYRAS